MDYCKIILLLLVILIISRFLYGKPIIELFQYNSWELCKNNYVDNLKKYMSSSTQNDINYNKLRLACKKCPEGFKRIGNNPNNKCVSKKKIKFYTAGVVDTMDEDCDYDCYVKRCDDYNMVVSKDYKRHNNLNNNEPVMGRLNCRPKSHEIVGNFIPDDLEQTLSKQKDTHSITMRPLRSFLSSIFG